MEVRSAGICDGSWRMINIRRLDLMNSRVKVLHRDSPKCSMFLSCCHLRFTESTSCVFRDSNRSRSRLEEIAVPAGKVFWGFDRTISQRPLRAKRAVYRAWQTRMFCCLQRWGYKLVAEKVYKESYKRAGSRLPVNYPDTICT